MAQISHLAEARLPPNRHNLDNQIASNRGHLAPPFAGLLNSPEVAGRVAALGRQLRVASSPVPPDMRDIVTFAAARELDYERLFIPHVGLAGEIAVRDKVVHVIRINTTLQPLISEWRDA